MTLAPVQHDFSVGSVNSINIVQFLNSGGVSSVESLPAVTFVRDIGALSQALLDLVMLSHTSSLTAFRRFSSPPASVWTISLLPSVHDVVFVTGERRHIAIQSETLRRHAICWCFEGVASSAHCEQEKNITWVPGHAFQRKERDSKVNVLLLKVSLPILLYACEWYQKGHLNFILTCSS